MEYRSSIYGGVVGSTVGKRLLGRCRHTGKNSIKMELQEVGLGVMDWTNLTQDGDRLWGFVNVVMKFQVS